MIDNHPLNDELRQIKALIEQRNILKLELEEGHKLTLMAFYIWLVQTGRAEVGFEPAEIVKEFQERGCQNVR